MNIRKIEAKNNKRKKRICAYVRVSTTKGSQIDSLENQKSILKSCMLNVKMLIFWVFFETKEFQVQSMIDLIFKLC